jgi:hypothetical protein
MGDLLGILVWGAKSGQYCVIGGGSLQMVSEQAHSVEWIYFLSVILISCDFYFYTFYHEFFSVF